MELRLWAHLVGFVGESKKRKLVSGMQEDDAFELEAFGQVSDAE
jgi:hypothetical protein